MITGATQLGDDRLLLTVDHDPRTTATDALVGSIIVYVPSGLMFTKLDDGLTMNVMFTTPLMRTVEIDLGSPGTRSKNFVIVDADATATSVISAWQSGIAATGRSADENEMDRISFAVLPAAGSLTIYATSILGPVSGLYKVHYMINS